MADTSGSSPADVPPPPPPHHVHGNLGVHYGGCWVDIEDLGKAWAPPRTRWSCDTRVPPPPPVTEGYDADVVVIGAGCVGSSISRELSKFKLRVLLLEKSDDVTQGATKGNSGIVHAGYDDVPGTRRAEFCWQGNQMFPALDKELRFGLQCNGSLVVARGAEDEATLRELLARGLKNGVKRLRIIDREELRRLEPEINPEATAALHSPDAGTLTPYEFTIALAENAVDNGVELRLNSSVNGLKPLPGGGFLVTGMTVAAQGSPLARAATASSSLCSRILYVALLASVALAFTLAYRAFQPPSASSPVALAAAAAAALGFAIVVAWRCAHASSSSPASSASSNSAPSVPFSVRARYVVNAAGIGSGAIAELAGDHSFYIKPRIGEYLLMNKREGPRARHILFPAPGKMGKGVLVQTTLWGNLILGPTAADLSDPATAQRTPAGIMESILARCRDLVPSFDAGAVIHTFSGLRAKSSAGDWVIRRSDVAGDLIHAAGIDSPGLAGSPAVALEVVRILREAGLPMAPNGAFNPNRKPIIVPKDHARFTAAIVAQDGSVRQCKIRVVDGPAGSTPPEANIVCKCEKVTEAEVIDAVRRSLPCESTQAVRKRTRAGMGHCQASPETLTPSCEERVKAIIAREKADGRTARDVPGRPWPASSILPQRWITEVQRDGIRAIAPMPTSLAPGGEGAGGDKVETLAEKPAAITAARPRRASVRK